MNKYEKILNHLLDDQETDNRTKAEIAMFMLKRSDSDPPLKIDWTIPEAEEDE